MTCDIVIPVWNQPLLTKDCVDSIIKNTDCLDYRLIIIDNASDEETKRYLESLKSSTSPRVFLVRNENNLGFVRAANQGMRLSEAPYVCLINNDTIAAKGWLSEMIRIADSSANIGLVNPSSNNLGQRPIKGESIETYAEKLKEYLSLQKELEKKLEKKKKVSYFLTDEEPNYKRLMKLFLKSHSSNIKVQLAEIDNV